jgi:hypothetical protein
MLTWLLSLNHLDTRQKIEFLTHITPYLIKDSNHEVLSRNAPRLLYMMEHKDKLTPDQLLFVLNAEKQIETLWEPAKAQFKQIAAQSGVPEIEKFLQTGLLDIHLLGANQDQMFTHVYMDDITGNNHSQPIIIEYINAISKIVLEGDAYPLFDDMTGSLVRNLIKENRIKVTETRTNRGKHTLLAGRLLEKLPLFDEATVDEIVDIRSELDKPLINFRQALIGFSEEMKNAPWDNDFPVEADQVFHQRVAPAILEIEEQVKQTQSLANFASRLINKPLASGGSLSVVISQAFALPDLASTALTMGGLTSSGATAIMEYREIWKERRDIERNQLYFYYKAGKLLSDD